MARTSAKGDRDRLSGATRLAILTGPERFLQDVYLQRLREDLAKVHGGEEAVQVVRFDGAPGGGMVPTTVADILDECRSMGLMTAFKVVIVDNADLLLKSAEEEEEESGAPKALKRHGSESRATRGAPKTNRELMEAYAQSPSDSAVLVLRAEGWRPGKLDKAVAKLGERGAVIKCEPPTSAEAVRWARDRCLKRYGETLTPEGAALLVENLGPELGRIDAELGKLALAEPGKPISAETVREFVGVSREEEFWKIEQTLLSGDAGAALAHLREMIEVSRHDPVPLNWAFMNLAKKIHGLSRGMVQGDNPRSLMGALKVWGSPDQVEQLLRVAKRVRPGLAAELLRAAVENDVKLKSSQGDPVINLEGLAVRFTSAFS